MVVYEGKHWTEKYYINIVRMYANLYWFFLLIESCGHWLFLEVLFSPFIFADNYMSSGKTIQLWQQWNPIFILSRTHLFQRWQFVTQIKSLWANWFEKWQKMTSIISLIELLSAHWIQSIILTISLNNLSLHSDLQEFRFQKCNKH